MHPNAFLRTFWRLELKPQIFVAMSFTNEYRDRYEQVISPAISSIVINEKHLEPYRVDTSKSGDCILTDIMDGIAHSQMILADVSSVGKDVETGKPYRNGNVMYEVGLALACREPSEVLLVRDDKDAFLFDVSTVPHMHLDFLNVQNARTALNTELRERLKEQNYMYDTRVRLALASLSNQEASMLLRFVDRPEGEPCGWALDGTVLSVYEAAIMRLLDKRLITSVAKSDKSFQEYLLTQLGRVVAKIVKSSDA